MSVYHVRLSFEDDWYTVVAVEDEKVFAQARTLDEAVVMLRDLLQLTKNDQSAELRLIVPAALPVDDLRPSGRVTDAMVPEDEAAANMPGSTDATPLHPRKASA